MEGKSIKINKPLIPFISGATALFIQIIYIKIYFYILSKFITVPVAKENSNFIFIISLVSALLIFVFVYDFLYKHLPKIITFKITRGGSSNVTFSNSPKLLFPLKGNSINKKGKVHFCKKNTNALKLNSSKVLKLNKSLKDRHR